MIGWIPTAVALGVLAWFLTGQWYWRRHLRRAKELGRRPETLTPEMMERHIREERLMLRWRWM